MKQSIEIDGNVKIQSHILNVTTEDRFLHIKGRNNVYDGFNFFEESLNGAKHTVKIYYNNTTYSVRGNFLNPNTDGNSVIWNFTGFFR